MTALPLALDRAACEALDRADPLACFRDRFMHDDAVIYLDGNSLGRLPRETPARIASLLETEWGRGLIRSWTDAAWMESPRRLGDTIARVIGARDDEVLVTDSTSVDLFKLVSAVLHARRQRRVVLTERENFPTDLYIARGAAALLGGGHEVVTVARDEVLQRLGQDVALLMLTHVDFRTGERLDMQALTRSAHDAGALVLWDLSHSTGAVHVDLHAAGVDLAVGCGYKYLNGGPGAPAFLYVARELQDELHNPIQGWLGHESPFTFETDYRGAPGIRGWMSGSPPIIAIAALEVAVDLVLEAGTQRIDAKAGQLTDAFIRLAEARLVQHGFEIASPRLAARRGAQVSLRHPQGYPIIRALLQRGVIGDFRDPDVCRFGFAPLYTRFVDVWDAVEHIDAVMREREHTRTEHQERAAIT